MKPKFRIIQKPGADNPFITQVRRFGLWWRYDSNTSLEHGEMWLLYFVKPKVKPVVLAHYNRRAERLL